MALLPSHLPFLYCMLCYRSSNRPSLRRQHVDRLLDLLAEYPNPESNARTRNPFPWTDSSERRRRDDRLGRYLLDRPPWIWHERHFDMDKLCNRSDLQRRRSTSKRFEPFDAGRRANHENCFTRQPDDIRQMLPNRFLTVEELMRSLPSQTSAEYRTRPQNRNRIKPMRRYAVNTGFHQDLKFFTHTHCSACYTEIGYEILSEVTDFEGQNHTVLNFQNAFQFIGAGRCLNENSPCGGGGQARCSQVYRAHWTLVWTPDKGTRLVAHEVPSHCECINVGAPLSTQEPARNLKRSLPTPGLGNG